MKSYEAEWFLDTVIFWAIRLFAVGMILKALRWVWSL